MLFSTVYATVCLWHTKKQSLKFFSARLWTSKVFYFILFTSRAYNGVLLNARVWNKEAYRTYVGKEQYIVWV